MNKPIKPKKCKICREVFTPFRPLHICCSLGCAIEYAQKNRQAKERKELRDAKEKAKTRAQWMKEAQAVFNSYIRKRDEGLPCISCGSVNRSAWDAGHFRTTAAAPELRFNEKNVHRQCVQCNQHQHGNLLEYRIGLVKRIGSESVEWLEGTHDPKKYTIDDLKSIKATYKAKLKELENGS